MTSAEHTQGGLLLFRGLLFMTANLPTAACVTGLRGLASDVRALQPVLCSFWQVISSLPRTRRSRR